MTNPNMSGLALFCDGSARNNGRAGAKAGFGVHTVSYTHLTLPTNREV